MAQSTCPKCESHSFEMVETIPKGSRFKHMFIQCALCGAVVGTTDYYSTHSLLDKIAQKIGVKLFD